jgi:predicted MFS family arabinose efflux permease
VDSTESSAAPQGAVARRGLRAVYVAGGTSEFGTQMTQLALPWLVLETTGSAPRAGLVFAVQVLPMALLGLAGAEVIQRLGGVRTMLVADAVRGPVIALVPILSALGLLSLGALLTIVAALGVLGVPYFAAQRVVTTELAGPDPKALTRMNSVLEGWYNMSGVAGPALAGVLIAVLGARQVIWIDAASYTVSCLLLWRFVPRGARAAQPAATTARAGILAGLRALRDDDFLRPAMTSTIMFGFLLRILLIALPLIAFDRFGRDAAVGGLLLGGFGAGTLIGSLITYLVANRMSAGRLMALAAVQLVLPLWLLMTSAPVAVLVAALVVSGASLPLSNAPFFTILATRCAGDIRAKVMQSVVALSNIASPLGYLAGGLAIGHFGVTTTMLALAALSTLAAVNLLRAIQRLRPAEQAGPSAGPARPPGRPARRTGRRSAPHPMCPSDSGSVSPGRK